MHKKKIISHMEFEEFNLNKDMTGSLNVIKNTKISPDTDDDGDKKPKQRRGMPRWFKVWSETRFEPLAKDVADLKVRMTNVENILQQHTDILQRHENILQQHTEIFIRNNLK